MLEAGLRSDYKRWLIEATFKKLYFNVVGGD